MNFKIFKDKYNKQLEYLKENNSKYSPSFDFYIMYLEENFRLQKEFKERNEEYLTHYILECLNIPRGSIGWRMGYGEEYLLKYYEWLDSSRRNIKKKLMKCLKVITESLKPI